MLVKVPGGLGDAIYCRPFVRSLAERYPVSIQTKWPDLFADIETDASVTGPVIAPKYHSRHLALGNIVTALAAHFPLEIRENYNLDLPRFPDATVVQPYALIRPPMLRADFYAPARNPLPEYVSQAVEIAKSRGLLTVGAAWVRDGVEWHDGPPPPVDIAFHAGELTVPALMALVAGAEVVIGGPGWQVPAALAYGVPAIVILGGFIRGNGPDQLTDPRIDASKLQWIEPDRPCVRCPHVRHVCDKVISNFQEKLCKCLPF